MSKLGWWEMPRLRCIHTYSLSLTQTCKSAFKAARGIFPQPGPGGWKWWVPVYEGFFNEMLKTSKWEWCLSSKIAARWSRKCTNFLWHSCNEVLYWPNSSVWNCSLLLSLLLLPALFVLPCHLFCSPFCPNHTMRRQVTKQHTSLKHHHICKNSII